MIHRLFTGIVLGMALWYAMWLLAIGPSLAILFAALPVLAAVLNLMTGPVFSLSVALAVPVICFFFAMDEPWFVNVVTEIRGFTQK